MKNREQLIIIAGDVISEFSKSHSKGFDLFFGNGVFACSESCHAERMGSFIRHFTVNQATIGLTGPQWLRLGKKAVNLQKEAEE
ncbi:MAG: hypothetical protein KAV87_63135 [Desulfobacteraceae bacterium]|nr:hypothetical protein [Desulfobacteraceae bacterium]